MSFDIYRKNSDVTAFSEISSYTEFTLISNMGAQLGLWAGLTFICLYDLMEKYAKLIFVDKLGKMYMKRFKMQKAEEKTARPCVNYTATINCTRIRSTAPLQGNVFLMSLSASGQSWKLPMRDKKSKCFIDDSTKFLTDYMWITMICSHRLKKTFHCRNYANFKF